MSYASQSARYLENEVLSRSPEWLVTLIYESLLSYLRRGLVQIEEGDMEGKADSLGRALALIGELLASLDHEKGGEISRGLASLYTYFTIELMNVSRDRDTESLKRIIAMVAELHEAWTEAAEMVAPRKRGGESLPTATAA